MILFFSPSSLNQTTYFQGPFYWKKPAMNIDLFESRLILIYISKFKYHSYCLNYSITFPYYFAAQKKQMKKKYASHYSRAMNHFLVLTDYLRVSVFQGLDEQIDPNFEIYQKNAHHFFTMESLIKIPIHMKILPRILHLGLSYAKE